MDKTICELFAGVGGFRLGMERLDSGWETVWFSQWEPDKSKQWAHDCYTYHFGDCMDNNGEYHTCNDISMINKDAIPDHTLLMVSAPCQDYSVAHSNATSLGIEGKKGVLWWQVVDVLEKKKPSFMIFENVDRLLKSPAKQRGRDFGIMLACLSKLGYSVEWRVVNAADYGASQRRRRVFMFAYKNDSDYGKYINSIKWEVDILLNDGFMVNAFPVCEIEGDVHTTILDTDIVKVSDEFEFAFLNAGFMKNGTVYTAKVKEIKETAINLGDILVPEADEKYCIDDDKLSKWKYLKGAKRIPRKSKSGHEYIFSEGAVAFPDLLDKPGRTMLTSEGTLNRSSHVVEDKTTGKLRILTPVETERLQGFDDDWTKNTLIGEMPERMRYFCMGNSLVVPMITRMGKVLDDIVG